MGDITVLQNLSTRSDSPNKFQIQENADGTITYGITDAYGTFTKPDADTLPLTLANALTITNTAGATLAVGAGGTLGTAAYTAATAYDVAGTAVALMPTVLGDYADDAAAAVGGIPVGGLYHTLGVVHIRLV